MKRLCQFAFTIILGLHFAAATNVVAQNAAVADKPAGPAASLYDKNTPGVGPIRTEDWFVKTWHDRRAKFAEQKAQATARDRILRRLDHAGLERRFPRQVSRAQSRQPRHQRRHDPRAARPGRRRCAGAQSQRHRSADRHERYRTEGSARRDRGQCEAAAREDRRTRSEDADHPLPGDAHVWRRQHRPTEKIRKLNQLLADVARGNEHVTVLDTYTLFANAEGEAKLEEFPDLLHPNDVGYAKWRAALWPLLATLGFVEKEPDAFTPEPGFELLFNGHDLDGWGFPQNVRRRRWPTSRSGGQATRKSPAYPIVERAGQLRRQNRFDRRTIPRHRRPTGRHDSDRRPPHPAAQHDARLSRRLHAQARFSRDAERRQRRVHSRPPAPMPRLPARRPLQEPQELQAARLERAGHRRSKATRPTARATAKCWKRPTSFPRPAPSASKATAAKWNTATSGFIAINETVCRSAAFADP